MRRYFRQLHVAAIVAACVGLFPAMGRAQVDPRAALLEQAGWDALGRGDARSAADSFRAALAQDPQNSRLLLGAGAAAYLERRDEDARAALERALTLNPRLTEARALLARVQYRTGDIDTAITTMGTVVADDPGDGGARMTLERWRREAELHDRMRDAVGERFTVSFEGPAQEAVAAEALRSLDRAYWRIGAILGVFPNAAIPVVLYTNEQFTDITRAPAWAGGAFDGTIRVPMAGAPASDAELDRVLAHEYVHALVRTIAVRGVPTWLNEGLASALESDELTWAEQIVRRSPAPASLRLQTGFGALSTADARLAYATSALAVRRLLDDAGGTALTNLLRDLGDGAEFEDAFLHRMQRSFSDFQTGLF